MPSGVPPSRTKGFYTLASSNRPVLFVEATRSAAETIAANREKVVKQGLARLLMTRITSRKDAHSALDEILKPLIAKDARFKGFAEYLGRSAQARRRNALPRTSRPSEIP